MRVLGIETSCDETGAAVVEDGHRIVSNVVASQAEIHARYGGVVPEVASRQHVTGIVPVVRAALAEAGVALGELDAVAATHGPGLAGALVVGLSLAKALALGSGRPLIAVNHLEAHIYANWLGLSETRAAPRFPLVCLIASGGHTDLVLMEDHAHYRGLGSTLDDAAGEAFDKAARIMGLEYPGGPAIQRVAGGGNADAEPLPRAWLGKGSLDFSFSGVKTAVLRRARVLAGLAADAPSLPVLPAARQADLAAGFQEAVVEVLAAKTASAAVVHEAREVLLAGGVAANLRLRDAVTARCRVPVRFPPPALCTDNAAMIAACGSFHLAAGETGSLDADVAPDLRLVAPPERRG